MGIKLDKEQVSSPIVILTMEMVLAVAVMAFLFMNFFVRFGEGLTAFDLLVFGNPSGTLRTMLEFNAANWSFASVVSFQNFAQGILVSIVLFMFVNLVIRFVTLLTQQFLKGLSIFLSLVMMTLGGIGFYLTFTFFEIYWNQPENYLGLIIFFAVGLVEFVMALTVAKHKSLEDDFVPTNTSSRVIVSTGEPVDKPTPKVEPKPVAKIEPKPTPVVKAEAPQPKPAAKPTTQMNPDVQTVNQSKVEVKPVEQPKAPVEQLAVQEKPVEQPKVEEEVEPAVLSEPIRPQPVVKEEPKVETKPVEPLKVEEKPTEQAKVEPKLVEPTKVESKPIVVETTPVKPAPEVVVDPEAIELPTIDSIMARRVSMPTPSTIVATPKEESINRYAGKFEVYPEAGLFKYRLKASNGEILVVSNGYVSRNGAIAGVETFKKNLPLDNFEIVTDKNNFSQFRMYSNLKTRVIVSGEFYDKQSSAESALISVKKFGLTDKIIHLNEIDKDDIREEMADLESVEKNNNGKIEVIFEDKRWWAQLKASNGEVLFVTDSYSTKNSLLVGLESVRTAIEKSNFRVARDKQNRYQFRLYSDNNQLLLVGETYGDKSSALSAVSSVRRFAPSAKIIELPHEKVYTKTDK